MTESAYERLVLRKCPATWGVVHFFRGTDRKKHNCPTCKGTGLDPATEGLRGKHDFIILDASDNQCRFCDAFTLKEQAGPCIPTSEAERVGRLMLWCVERGFSVYVFATGSEYTAILDYEATEGKDSPPHEGKGATASEALATAIEEVLDEQAKVSR